MCPRGRDVPESRYVGNGCQSWHMKAPPPPQQHQVRRTMAAGRIRFRRGAAALVIVGVALLAANYYATTPLKQPALAMQLPTATPTASPTPSLGQGTAIRVWVIDQPSIWPSAFATALW